MRKIVMINVQIIVFAVL